MIAYTVKKQGPNSDREFRAYIDLLQDIGIDVADAPRTPAPDAANRWLYVWTSKPLAERFARELGARLRDPSWSVHELEVPSDQLPDDTRGPLIPLTILSIPTSAGAEYRLEPASLERILAHYPNARLAGQVLLPQHVHGHPELDQVIHRLTGIPDDAILRLGGIRVVDDEQEAVLYERLPTAAAQA